LPFCFLDLFGRLEPQVVCTLGPKSRSVEILEELLRTGMSVARFNFSHGSHEYHQVDKRSSSCLGRNARYFTDETFPHHQLEACMPFLAPFRHPNTSCDKYMTERRALPSGVLEPENCHALWSPGNVGLPAKSHEKHAHHVCSHA
jgi:Pyruvate kinase, barrel domain